MATITTTGSISGLLSIPDGSFDDAMIAAFDFFAEHFEQVVVDALTGNRTIYSITNNYLYEHVYGANGNAQFWGSGFYGTSGSVSQISFVGEGGSFLVKGSGNWNANTISLTGSFSSIETHYGSAGLLLEGSLKTDSNGNLIGTITHQVVYSDNMTLHYYGSMSASALTGTVTKIVLNDNSGNSLTVIGSYSVAAFQAVIDATNSPDEVLNTPSLFAGNDTFIVPDASREWHGFDGADKLTGGANSDTLFGDSGNDSLVGLFGSDSLDGGAGVDVMTGGLGDDWYFVDNSLDKVIELIGAGHDTVESTANYVLGANVEDLLLAGNNSINGTGNALDNLITGNSANNVLSGGLGADIMIGGGGDDTFFVDNAGDAITAGSGNDTVVIAYSNASLVPIEIFISTYANIENLKVAGTGFFNLTGDANDNFLTGNASINVLTGGDGDDTFFVGAGDVIIEGSGVDSGIDTVNSAISWILADNIENLNLTGTSTANGTGNNLNNVITGNTGANILNGGVGADSMFGSAGNDTYFVDDLGDSVSETIVGSAGGVDLVKSSVSFTLGSNLENLTLTGGDIDGTGNSSINIVLGSGGDNTLDGAGGIDKLAGGLGNDTFIVDLILSGSTAKLQDTVSEASGGGTDTLILRGDVSLATATTLTLGSNLENYDISLTNNTLLNITGNALNNHLIGNAAANTLNGGSGSDTLDGGDGLDRLIGGLGADTFVFHEATAFNNIDVVSDFNAILGDKLDIRDVLDGYSGPISDWVQITDSCLNSIVEVDRDGSGGSFGWTQIATLTGVTGLAGDEALVVIVT